MSYAYVVDSKVYNIIPEEDPVFPSIPIEQRYSSDIISKLVQIPSKVHVGEGWLYDSTSCSFTAPATDVSKKSTKE